MGKKRISKEEIEELYREFNTPEHVIRHCRAVTDAAMRIAGALNEHGHKLDLELIEGAGLCHDVARVMEEHWNVMADKLEELGYEDESKIVRVHMEPSNYNPISNLNESDMVNLGDRLVKEDQYVGIDERFDYILDKARKHGFLTDAHQARIMKNKAKMQSVLDGIEEEIGQSIDSLFE